MGIFDLFEDLAEIVVAPVSIVASVARVVTKPVAEVATFVKEELEDLID